MQKVEGRFATLAAALDAQLKLLDPALEAVPVPAIDEGEDPEIEVRRAGKPAGFALQFCQYGDFGANSYQYDAAGELESMTSLYFGESADAAVSALVGALREAS